MRRHAANLWIMTMLQSWWVTIGGICQLQQELKEHRRPIDPKEGLIVGICGLHGGIS